MNDVRIVLTFSDITKSEPKLRSLSVAFYGCKGNTFSRHRQIFMQKSLLFRPPKGITLFWGQVPRARFFSYQGAVFWQGKPCLLFEKKQKDMFISLAQRN